MPTWFDEFFNAITKSREFKKAMTKDWSWDLTKSLKEMEEKLAKTSDLATEKMWEFNNSFSTKEATQTWKSLSTNNNVETKENKESSIEVEYFTVKNPETFWFKWIAWMQELKDNLTENFIKPLKFKFLVEELTNQQTYPEKTPPLIPLNWGGKLHDSEVGRVEDEKTKVYKALYEEYEKFKISIPTWLMFYWPPWTGKTFITKKLAEELWAWLIKKSVWEFWSSYLHQTSKNIKDFFEESKKASKKWPIILFLDEIDSLVSTRSEKADWNKAEEISQFLQEFNNLSDAQNLIVVWATNRPDHLDSAILRTWRFDKKFYIWPPDFEARKELFEIYIKKEKRPEDNLDYYKLPNLTEGYVPADIEWICDEVARVMQAKIFLIWLILWKVENLIVIKF